jgi:hypothetical protein
MGLDTLGKGPPFPWKGLYSTHVRILPFLGQNALYHSVNFQTGTLPSESPGIPAGVLPYKQVLNQPNRTVIASRVAVFLCPSDGAFTSGPGVNYRACVGIGWNSITMIESPDSNNGLLPDHGTIRMANVRDGLSHTVAFSERLRGSGRGGLIDTGDFSRARDLFPITGDPYDANSLLVKCQLAQHTQRPGFALFTHAGDYWFWVGRPWTHYTNTQTPNGAIPDCCFFGDSGGHGMVTARSAHKGGVSTLMGDGSCRYTADSISLQVWRGLGTRSGGELVD